MKKHFYFLLLLLWAVAIPNPNFANNLMTVDLELSLTVDDPGLNIYSYKEYNLTVTNNGSSTAENVEISFPLPSGLVLDNQEVESGHYSSWNGVWNDLTVLPGESITLTLNLFSLTEDAPITSYAQVMTASPSDSDSTPGNGTSPNPSEDDEAAVTITPGGGPVSFPDLELDNFQIGISASPGDVVNYTVDLINSGDALAEGDYEIGVWLSPSSVVVQGAQLVGVINTGNTGMGTIPNVPGAITIPASIATGDYFLIIRVDENNDITESDENNNRIWQSFIINNGTPTCSGNITLDSQAEVDAFGPCTNWDGDINIIGENITNLNGLSGLQTVSGALFINDATNLTNLSGLEDLQEVETLVFQNTGLSDLAQLTSLNQVMTFVVVFNENILTLNGVQGLTSVSGTVIIQDNTLLQNVTGLDNLTSAEGLQINDNNSITNINQLQNLTQVGNIEIISNPLLTSLSPLNGIGDIEGLYVISNSALTNIGIFPNVTAVTSTFVFDDNTALTDINGFPNLTSVGGNFYVANNDLLENLNGFENLTNIGFASSAASNVMTIQNNLVLSECCGISNALNSLSNGQYADISGNVQGCNDAQEIINACIGDCGGDIVLGTQAEVDAFNSTCTTWVGSITIRGTDIIDLTPLQNLEIITGDLSLQSAPNLSSLVGLNHLTSANRIILDNTGLFNIVALNNLTQTTQFVTSLNPNLTSLDGLQGITSLSQALVISESNGLTSLEGLNNLESIGFFLVQNNVGLENFDGLENLTSVSQEIILGDNNDLQNMDALGNLEYIEQFLIQGSPALQRLPNLVNITEINGRLAIISTDIQDVSGLENLERLGEGLTIANNENLQNLNALQNLISVGENTTPSEFINVLIIADNPILSECCGIYNLANEGFIQGNVIIQNNQDFCNSLNDIRTNCNECGGDIVLSTQAEVDAFNPDCEIWEGSIRVSGNGITDLSPLSGIREITGDFTLENLTSAGTFPGFPLLETVGNQFLILYCGFVNLTGLDNLENIGQAVTLVDNENLVSLLGFSPNTTIEDFTLVRNSSLVNVNGLDQLTVTKTLQIEENGELLSLAGLKDLPSSIDFATVQINEKLTDLRPFQTVQNANDGLLFVGNESLTNVDDLGILQFLGGELVIAENDLLQNLAGLQSLTSLPRISVVNNEILSDCCGIFNVLNTGGVADVNIQGNPSFCAFEQDIINNCSPSGDIDLSLNLTVSNSNPGIYQSTTYTLSVTNAGPQSATGVTIDFPVPTGLAFTSQNVSDGHYSNWNGSWEISNLASGQTATLDLVLFTLSEDPITSYAQVSTANETDTDSTPGNGSCCSANEDDEADITINRSGNDLPNFITQLDNIDVNYNINQIRFSYNIQNNGTGPGGPVSAKIYFSDDATVSSDDLVVTDYFSLAPMQPQGVAVFFENTFTFPANLQAGNYYLISVVDPEDLVEEEYENNNNIWIEEIPINIQNPTEPDLAITLTNVAVDNVGLNISVSADFKNLGNGPANFYGVNFYISESVIISASDPGGQLFFTSEALFPGQTNSVNLDFQIPPDLANGQYYLNAYIDGQGDVSESNEGNNIDRQIITISLGEQFADLRPTFSTVNVLPQSQSIDVDVLVENIGDVAATDFNLGLYLSADQTPDAGDVGGLYYSNNPTLQPGDSDFVNSAISYASLPSGTYYVIAVVDPLNETDESNESNNTILQTVQITNTLQSADLYFRSYDGVGVANEGEYIDIGFTIENQGIGTAGTSTMITYLSTDENISADDLIIGINQIEELASGEATSSLVSIDNIIAQIPEDIDPGVYKVISLIDANNDVAESDENNNTIITNININGIADIDLVNNSLIVPSELEIGVPFEIEFSIVSLYADAGPSSIRYYFTEGNFNQFDTIELGIDQIGALTEDDELFIQKTLTLPAGTTPGQGTLRFDLDYNDEVEEYDEFNSYGRFVNTTVTGYQLISVDCPEGPILEGEEFTLNFTLQNSSDRVIQSNEIFLAQQYFNFRFDFGDPIYGSVIIPTLQPGETVDLSLNASINPLNYPGLLISYNLAIYNFYLTFSPSGGFNQEFEMVDLLCQEFNSELSVELSTDDLTFGMDGAINYTMTIRNDGPETAYYQVIDLNTTSAPFGQYIDLDLPVGRLISTGTGPFFYKWVLPPLAPGEEIVVNFDYDIYMTSAGEPVYDPFIVDNGFSDGWGNLTDSNLDNNRDILEFVFQPEIQTGMDLELSLTANTNDLNIYESVVFDLEVFNNGSENATNVVVLIPLPEGLVYSSDVATVGSYDSWLEEWDIGDIAAGESVIMELTLFTLVGTGSLNLYAEIFSASPTDIDSTPDNGGCCTINEDDEAVWTLTAPSSGIQAYQQNEKQELTRITNLYPNPAYDYLILDINSTESSDLTIDFYDTRGQLLQSKTISVFKGRNDYPLEISELPDGIYFTHIRGGVTKNNRKRFVKQRF